MAQNPGRLNFLIVEDSDDYVVLLKRYLGVDGENRTFAQATSLAEARAALEQGGWDVVLLDYILVDCTAEAVLDLRNELAPEVPVIIVTGTVGEEHAADLMRAGADDLVLKDNLARLRPSIERELQNVETRRAKKRAEEAHAESEERFRAIFELSPAGIALINVDGRYEMVNPAMCEMVGYSEEEMKRMNWRDITPAEDWKKLEQIATGLFGGKSKKLPVERRYLTKDGQVVWTSMTSGFIPDENGRPKYIIGQFQDITEQREVERKLHQSQKMEAVGQLTGGVAHDFNNLLAIILGNLELLKPAFRQEEDTDELLESALEAVMRGSDLTSQLLAFSRRQELETQVVDVSNLVSGMDTLLRRTIGEDIDIVTGLGKELGLIRTDPSQLENAFLNLAINARDAMPGGGKLMIETSNVVLDEDYVEVNPYAVPGAYICISVCDTGTGISEEDLERIFDPFFTTKEVGKGTGLGLSMVFGFVRQSGGHINVYSELGHGTRFRIYLPRTDEAGEPRRDTPRPGGILKGTGIVLVVEDEQKVRDILMRQVKKLGYEVIGAQDAVEAIEILESDSHVDLLMTDMIMPGGMNGHELAERAKEMRPALAVLLTSGYPRDAFQHGRNFPLISKPFGVEQLSNAIKDAMSRD